MFIKITKNATGQSYYHLVESYWENGKSRQRTLLSLGRVGEDRLDELATAISRHKEIYTILDLAKHIDIEETYVLGPVLVVEKMFETSGINEVLKRIAVDHSQISFDLRKKKGVRL